MGQLAHLLRATQCARTPQDAGLGGGSDPCLEADAEAVVSQYSGFTPESSEATTPEENSQLYRVLRINMRAHVDGTMDIEGMPGVCNSDSIA